MRSCSFCHSQLKRVLLQQELTVQQRHRPVGGAESAVCDSLVGHKHHGHVGAGGRHVWRKGGTAEPETNKPNWGWIANVCPLLTEDLNKIQHLSRRPGPGAGSPSQHATCSGVEAVVHLHIIKLANILSLQAEVPEAQRDDVTVLHRQMPYAQLRANGSS